jgi:hypothetical protein
MSRVLRLQLYIHEDSFPELFEEIQSVSPKRRCERIRSLASKGLDSSFKMPSQHAILLASQLNGKQHELPVKEVPAANTQNKEDIKAEEDRKKREHFKKDLKIEF